MSSVPPLTRGRHRSHVHQCTGGCPSTNARAVCMSNTLPAKACTCLLSHPAHTAHSGVCLRPVISILGAFVTAPHCPWKITTLLPFSQPAAAHKELGSYQCRAPPPPPAILPTQQALCCPLHSLTPLLVLGWRGLMRIVMAPFAYALSASLYTHSAVTHRRYQCWGRT
jgi:hypothetical protein